MAKSSSASGAAARFFLRGALRSRNFKLYQTARLMAIIGDEAQTLAVAWQVYQITHSALDLGYTGLALFLPGVFFMLPAGHVADRYNRQQVMAICYALQAVCTGGLLYLTHTGRFISSGRVWPIYAVLTGIGLGRCFSGPASSALLPSLVDKEDFVNAVTLGGAVMKTANITGPAAGGLLFTVDLTGRLASWNGAGLVYAFTLTTLVASIALVSLLRPNPERREKQAFRLRTMLAGLEYVWRTRLLLGSISLDLFAMLLGGATALLPIFADNILHTGPKGLALLRTMPQLGALTVGLVLALRPIRHHAGKTMLCCVAVFGAATVLFGLSTKIWLSLFALTVIGASDMVSVVVRSSVLQLATPPEMRGRVSAVNWLFLGASNELGEFESGLTAHWWGAVRAVVIGGIGSVAVTGAAAMLFPALRRADALTAESLREVEAAECDDVSP